MSQKREFLYASQAAASFRSWLQDEGLRSTGRSGRSASPEDQFDRLVVNAGLRAATEKLYKDGHHALAVAEAFKYINNRVKEKSGLTKDGASLMTEAFRVESPVLRLSSMRSQSDKDEQIGYMMIFAGCMTGIRNPRAHEHQYTDDPSVALEMLVMANHLADKLEKTRRSRKR